MFVHLDDLLIVSKTMADHLEHLRKVLDRLQEVGLKLKPSKCGFAKERVEYLGHTLSAEGVLLNDAKIEAVRNFPRPKSSKEVKSFLGLVNFYCRHLPNFCSSGQATDKDQQDVKDTSTIPVEQCM